MEGARPARGSTAPFSSGVGEGAFIYIFIYPLVVVETKLDLRSSVRFRSPPRPSPISTATILTFSRKHSVTLGAADDDDDDDDDADDGTSLHCQLRESFPLSRPFKNRVLGSGPIQFYDFLIWTLPIALAWFSGGGSGTNSQGVYPELPPFCLATPPRVSPADHVRDLAEINYVYYYYYLSVLLFLETRRTPTPLHTHNTRISPLSRASLPRQQL